TGSQPNQPLEYSPTSLAGGTSTHAHVVSDTSSGTCGTVFSNTASITTDNVGSGSATATITESPEIFFSEDFDGVSPPALPAGWTAANAQGGVPLWVTSDSGVPSPPADSPPNAASVDDPPFVSDKRIDTPTVAVPNVSAPVVTFRNDYNLESNGSNYFDGGVLEISIDGGRFTDILAAGGSFATGGYTGTISTQFGSPIAGRPACTGNSGGFVTTTATLPACGNGHEIVLPFRLGSDQSAS